MTSRKCDRCGFVSWAESISCKRCGLSFVPTQTTPHQVGVVESTSNPTSVGDPGAHRAAGSFSATKPSAKGRALAQGSLGALGVGLILAAVYFYTGAVPYPLALLSFFVGLVLSIVAVTMIRNGRANRGGVKYAMTGVVANCASLALYAVIPILVLSVSLRADKPEWREYLSKAGRFTVQMPAEPQERFKDLPSELGALRMHIVEADLKGEGVCSTIYFDYYNNSSSISEDQLLDAFLQRASSEGTLISKKSISLNGHKGFEIETRPNESKYGSDNLSMARIYVMPENSSLYMNIVTARASGELYNARFKFLDSFQTWNSQEIEDKISRIGGGSPLVDATADNDMDRVRRSLAQGTDTTERYAALVRAVIANKSGIAKELLQAGVEVNNTDQQGKTPLMWAATHCDSCVPALIAAGADVNAQDRQHGWTPLMWTLVNNRGQSARALVALAGENLNIKDKNGKTALMHAAGRNQEIATALVAAGADINVRNDKGETALVVAVRHAGLNPKSQKHADMVELLKKAGASE